MELVLFKWEYWSELMGEMTSDEKLMTLDEANFNYHRVIEMGGTASIDYLEQETA